MKTIFDYIQVSFSEYEYFKQEDTAGKLEIFFQMYDSQNSDGKLNLSAFFNTVKDYIDSETEDDDLNDYSKMGSEISYDYESYEANYDRVDVMIDDSTIMIESNSLKATRLVTYRFIESGYILSRDVAMEKLFRKDKVTRYLRIFRIIDHSTGICLN